MQVSEGCLLHVRFALVQFDGIWGQAEMSAAGVVGMIRRRGYARPKSCNI